MRYLLVNLRLLRRWHHRVSDGMALTLAIEMHGGLENYIRWQRLCAEIKRQQSK